MLKGIIFNDNQVPFSVWLDEESAEKAVRGQDSIAKARAKRLRRMQSQNFIQRAAFEVVQLFTGARNVA